MWAGPYSLLNNVSPNRGILGLQASVLLPFSGDGQLFQENEDFPHGDYGVSFGLDYWKSNRIGLDYHLGAVAKYVQYHFHFTPEGGTDEKGQFALFYTSIPLTFHLRIPNYRYLQLIAGVAISSMNFAPNVSGNIADYQYSTRIDLRWFVAPELILGINFMEEKTDYFFIRGSINYSAFILRNQSYWISMNNSNRTLAEAKQMPSNRVELVIAIYPKWKFKRSISKDAGINCPDPF